MRWRDLALALTFFSLASSPARGIWEGLELRGIDGEALDTRQLEGRIVLIDFWATWCAPCLAELPELQRLHEQHRSVGFEILGVNYDGHREPRLRR